MKETWIIPCNNNIFNVTEYLSKSNEIAFKQLRNIQIGDDVYLYISGDKGQIKYKGHVIETNCTESTMVNHNYAISTDFWGKRYHYFLVKIDYTVPDNLLPYTELKTNGIGQVQTQARASRLLLNYINEKLYEKIG